MAKDKRSASDLDAELAALEAEIAALEGKPKRAKSSAAAPSAPTDTKSRFSLPKLGKKSAEGAPAQPPPAPPRAAEVDHSRVPMSAAESTPPAPAPSPTDAFDMSVWRQEGDAWIRSVPETPVPVLRRVLDEQGNTVREEAADPRDIEDVGSVKAERGLGRLLRRK